MKPIYKKWGFYMYSVNHISTEKGGLSMQAVSICLILSALVLVYLAWENWMNLRCLSSFKAVIHVNGIRGKTSTCRYLDAALRTKYRVFTKTTGTDARFIGVNGTEQPVRRLGPANIHEQLRTIRRARREGAEILILECMAVNPELQKIAQERIVRSNITIITNARYDHIFEMGDTLEGISASLSATIPENGTLYTADPELGKRLSDSCQRRNCRLVVCPSTGTASENIGIARAVSASLDVSEEDFQASIPQAKQDFGARHLYEITSPSGKVVHFLNLFSANDPQSTHNIVEEYASSFPHLAFLYNHREDRPDRALLFARYFLPFYPDSTVFLTGRGAALPKRLFRNAGVSDLRVLSDWHGCLDLPENTLLVGIGNIKGCGYQLIKELDAIHGYKGESAYE